MADIDDFLLEIRPSVPDCPEPAMYAAIIRAARVFCFDSWFVRRSVTLDTVANQSLYTLVTPVGEEVFALKHAQIYSPETGVIPLRFAYGTFQNPNSGLEIPNRITYIPDGVVSLYPTPDQAYEVTVEVLTQPSLETQVIPDELASSFRTYIGAGALAWLYSHKGQSYYDPVESLRKESTFNAGINKAKAKAAFDNTPGPQAWVNRGFAGGRRRR